MKSYCMFMMWYWLYLCPGLLCCSSELGFKEVHDRMVYHDSFMYYYSVVSIVCSLTCISIEIFQCCPLSRGCYFLCDMVDCTVFWWFLQSYLWETWCWNIWWVIYVIFFCLLLVQLSSLWHMLVKSVNPINWSNIKYTRGCLGCCLDPMIKSQ